jgi:hypothetical protein
MPINMGELLPTSPVMQAPDSPSPASKATDTTATNKDLEKGPEPVLCHHCGRTASNGISCEGYCVADSNY